MTRAHRLLIALLLGVVLTFGAVAPHEDSAEHDREGHGAFIDQAASHPEDPPHIEASKAAYVPGCQTCLMHLQTGSRLIAPLVPLPDLIRGETVTVFETVAVSTPASLLGPARAPPASSLVL